MHFLGSHRARPAYRLLRVVSRTPGWVRWLAFLVVWGLGAAMLASTPTTEVAHHTPLQAAYAAVRLFALDPPGFPAAPGTPAGIALWVAYLLSPLLTFTAAADFVRRHLLAPEVLARGYERHAVICGLGAHGLAMAEACVRRGEEVIVLDRTPGGVGSSLDLGEGEALVLEGDMTQRDALLAAGVLRARRVVLASGSPLVNMEAARQVRDLVHEHDVPGPRLHTLVDQSDILLGMLGQLGLGPGDVVDQFASSSRHLVQSPRVQAMLGRIAAGLCPPRITIVGFGRFGQAVLRQLREDPALRAGPPLSIELVDRRAADRAVHVRGDVESCTWRLHAPPGGDAERWVADLVDGRIEDLPGVVFLCIDHDMISLRCAARLHESPVDVAVVLRVARPLDVASDDVLTFNVPELFAESLEEVLAQAR